MERGKTALSNCIGCILSKDFIDLLQPIVSCPDVDTAPGKFASTDAIIKAREREKVCVCVQTKTGNCFKIEMFLTNVRLSFVFHTSMCSQLHECDTDGTNRNRFF